MNQRLIGIALAVIGLALASTWPQAHAADMRRSKKLIETGWDEPNTQTLRKNLAEIEKSPFDGVVIGVLGKSEDGTPCSLRTAFANQPWQRSWFQSAIDDLKACRFQHFTDNFFILGANPGNVDWFDDAGWRTIVEHWRIAAWVARQAGVKGILFDPEPYSEPFAQFRYRSQPQADQHTFDEYCAKARQRGREVIQAVAEEYPEITLFCYFMTSITSSATGRADQHAALENQGYGLYPAFLDGWLDAIPPTMTLVDGCESAYRYNSQKDFLEAGILMKGDCQELISPENRAKYRAQVQVSFGIYLDAYWNPRDSEAGKSWYIDGLGGSRVNRLRANVRTALRVADEYVWIYGEKFRWWSTSSDSAKPQKWSEALPGCEDALRFARDPSRFAREKLDQLKQAGKLTNLARNGDFAAPTVAIGNGGETKDRDGGPPTGWSTWQEDNSKGSFAWDRQTGLAAKGSAEAAGVRSGCFLQSCPVRPGELYVVRAARKLHGKGGATVRIRWQTSDEKWTAEEQDQFAYAVGPVDQWSEAFTVVQVPEGVGRLVIMLSVRGQRSAGDLAWFDDVQLYRIP